MADSHGIVIPTQKLDQAELETVVGRAVKILREPLELRAPLPLPQGAEDIGRGQFRASNLMVRLQAMVPQLGPGKLIGPEGSGPAKPQLDPAAFVFVTDVDLFTEKSDGVFAAMLRRKRLAVVSVRRLREAFYRRKADLAKQRSRQVKEIVRMVARLRGMPQCEAPACVLAPSKMLADLDLKEEKFCRACSQRFFTGSLRI